MSSLLTRCPQCSTTFRISKDQLGAAGGSVRCGACLAVFQGDENLIEDESPMVSATNVEADITERGEMTQDDINFEQDSLIEEDGAVDDDPEIAQIAAELEQELLADDDLEDDLEVDVDHLLGGDIDETIESITDQIDDVTADSDPALEQPTELSDATDNESVDAIIEAEAPANEAPENEDTSTDELNEAAMAVTEDNNTPDVTAAESSDIDDFDELIHDDMEDEDDEPAVDDITDTIEIAFNDDQFARTSVSENDSLGDESWAEELLAELEDESIDDPLADRPDLIDDYATDLPAEPTPPPVAPRGNDTPQIIAPAARLGDFEEEPLELEQNKRSGLKASQLMLWLGITLTAISVFATQFATRNFNELALDDRYRPYYIQACAVIGCTVPKQQALDEIKVTNTYSRTHGRDSQLLTIEIIIKNNATFKQPFPSIDIFFDNTAGQTVASRRLKPSEYLQGSMAGASLMPSQTPIRIAVDILDPGTDAAFHKVLIAN